jgi:LysM repeat protein
VLSKLAVKYGCKLNDIYRLNDGIDAGNAHKIRAGTTIRIPVGSQGAEAATVAAPTSPVRAATTDTPTPEYFERKVVTAEARDNMFTLALQHYGSMSMFRLIKEANPDIDWTDVKGGEQIVIPEYGKRPATLERTAADSVDRSSLIPARR